MYSKKNREGSLLIESIVAISVAVVGILGVLGLLSRAFAIQRDVGQRFIGTYLASEGIEVVKGIIDTNGTQRSSQLLFEILEKIES